MPEKKQERGPLEGTAFSTNRYGNETNASIVPHNVPIAIDPPSWLAGFDCGRDVGRIEMWRDAHKTGYQNAVEDLTETLTAQIDAHYRDHFTDVNKAVVDLVLKRGSYQLAAERRNQPERAARQRQILTEKGI